MERIPYKDMTKDIDEDDAFDPDDGDVNWDQIELLARQIEDIQGMEDPDQRLAAAKAWAAELAQ